MDEDLENLMTRMQKMKSEADCNVIYDILKKESAENELRFVLNYFGAKTLKRLKPGPWKEQRQFLLRSLGPIMFKWIKDHALELEDFELCAEINEVKKDFIAFFEVTFTFDSNSNNVANIVFFKKNRIEYFHVDYKIIHLPLKGTVLMLTKKKDGKWKAESVFGSLFYNDELLQGIGNAIDLYKINLLPKDCIGAFD
jgi:hypothetical protein